MVNIIKIYPKYVFYIPKYVLKAKYYILELVLKQNTIVMCLIYLKSQVKSSLLFEREIW